MRNNKFLFVIYLSISLWCSSCTKDITIENIPYKSKISIQSLIVPNEYPKVYVHEAVPYFNTKITASSLFRRDVIVTMKYDDKTIDFTIDSLYNIPACEYFVFWKGNQKIEKNKTYTLEVKENATSYIATATTNQDAVQLDKVSYVQKFTDVYGEHEGVVLDFTDKLGSVNFYRYEMNRVIKDSIVNPTGILSPCSIGKTNPVTEIGRIIFPDTNLDGEPITIVFEPTYKHKKDQKAFVILQSMDENTFKYYDNLDKNKAAQYNPFVEPVYLKNGQFGEKAFGVFGAYAISDTLSFVYPE